MDTNNKTDIYEVWQYCFIVVPYLYHADITVLVPQSRTSKGLRAKHYREAEASVRPKRYIPSTHSSLG
jgi:hypothetical protein